MARQRKDFSPPLPVAPAIPSPPALAEAADLPLPYAPVRAPTSGPPHTLPRARPFPNQPRLRTVPDLFVVNRLPLTEVAFPTSLTQAGSRRSGFEKYSNKVSRVSV